MIAGGTATGYAVYPEIIETTGIQLSTLNSAIGVMFLFLGWGCLFWSVHFFTVLTLPNQSGIGLPSLSSLVDVGCTSSRWSVAW